MQSPHRTAHVVISFAPADGAVLATLLTHLAPMRRQGWIDIWHGQLNALGGVAQTERQARWARADLILLLVTPHYLASDDCMDEDLPAALARQAAGTACVVPIYVRPVDVSLAPFGRLVGLPRDGRPVAQHADPDGCWADIAVQLRVAVRQQVGCPSDGPTPQTPAWPRALLPRDRVHRAPELRRALALAFATATDFDEFCIDYYPEVYRRFSHGMDMLQRTNLLMVLVDHDEALSNVALWIQSKQLPAWSG